MTSIDPLAVRARELALLLTSWPSVTGTKGEAEFPARLTALLADLPYFRDHPDAIVRLPIEGGRHRRANVLALVRGSGSRTIMLSGHFDTVPIDDYGDLAHLATEPPALRDALIERLQGTDRFALAREDLASGRFLPGRGLLDMKSGLAAGIAVLEQFAARPERDGNILLISTPDEEDRSDGMRAAMAALPEFLRDHGLEVALCINLDALCDNGDGTAGRTVAFGCIGKLLLSALVVGKEAHACYPLDGVNASYLAAELVAELEFAPDLGERSGDELAAPPTILGARDLKEVYNVTTPGRAWLFWNVLTQRRTAREVLQTAHALADRALTRARDRLADRARRFSLDVDMSEAWSRLSVTSFQAVFDDASARDPEFPRAFEVRAAELADADDLDLPTRSRILTEFAWDRAGLPGPAIVLGFGSMPYPAVNWPTDGSQDELAQAIRQATARTSAERDVGIATCQHLPVIVDMSFLGQTDPDDLRATAEATPLWGSSIRWGSDEPAPGFPVVNIGPWGRDYHHWLERVEVRYAFDVLPYLVANIMQTVLSMPPSGCPRS